MTRRIHHKSVDTIVSYCLEICPEGAVLSCFRIISKSGKHDIIEIDVSANSKEQSYTQNETRKQEQNIS